MRKFLAALLAATLFVVSGCGIISNINEDSDDSYAESTAEPTQTAGTAVEADETSDTEEPAIDAIWSEDEYSSDDVFSNRDSNSGYEDCVEIILKDGASYCDSEDVSIDGDVITISGEGSYLVFGSLSSGQIIIDSTNETKIQLILNGVTITNDSSACIYIKQADKVFLTLAEGSENPLSVTGEYVAIDDNNIDSVVFSKDDLTINGSGSLTIDAEYGHGIVSKDDLIITGGEIVIDAQLHGMTGKDCIGIKDCTLDITSGKDGIHTENTDDADAAYIYIESGDITVNAGMDAISAMTKLQIDGGSFDLTSGGGSSNASYNDSGMNWSWGQWGNNATGTEDSAKALKADEDIVINGGSFVINSSDDAIHTNASVYINDGEFAINSGDDGIHADASTAINGGSIDIQSSYEGIEGMAINISGGEINVVSSDDGLNAAGGTDSSSKSRPGAGGFDSASTDCYISISGGYIVIDADGDGIDSNGSLVISGGEIYVNGPTNNGNGALDYSTSSVSNAVVVAIGSSGMALGLSGASIDVTVSTQSAGTAIQLFDSDGNLLVEYTSLKQFTSVVIAAPSMVSGESYTLKVGGSEYTVTAGSSYNSGQTGGYPGGNPGGMGGGMGGNGGRP